MKKAPVVVWSVLGTVAALLVLALAFLFSGAYDVAADSPHTGVTRWALHALMDRSVETRASSVEGVAPTDPEALRHGFGEYDEMCVTCHGAPGVERGSIGKGLNPEPPDLGADDAETDDAELFWIVDHGIKFTGMPGFGDTHSAETVWAIVAFVKQLPGMSAARYAQWRAEYAEHAEEQERADEHEGRGRARGRARTPTRRRGSG